MRLRWLALALVVLAPSAAFAQNWVSFSETETVSASYDPGTVRSSGPNRYRVWMRADYSRDASSPARHIDWHVEIDCSSETARWLSFIERNDRGDIVQTVRNDATTEWTDTNPGTTGALLQAVVCRRG